MDSKKLVRCAAHAGSWYDSNPNTLGSKLKGWLDSATSTIQPQKLKAIIGPHAGYSFCGHVAAFAYQYVAQHRKQYKTVVLLGPSHKVHLSGCAISNCTTWETPIGNFEVDQDIYSELLSNKSVEWQATTKKIDENEHSMEMHLPFMRLCLDQGTKIVPIMVGNLSDTQADKFGKVLAKYFDRDDTLFVISSDFCHWGSNFDYRPYDKSCGQIHEYIEKLDHEGMHHIENNDYNGFTKYLSQTDNTICGREPIKLLLKTIKSSQFGGPDIKFVKYDQSNKVMGMKDMSVSYASALVYL
jgi:AmmeMemoRadiSam system protein B